MLTFEIEQYEIYVHTYRVEAENEVLGNQGACVIAKSYELKAKGVTTGMPIWEALPRCPQAIFVKRDFAWYEVLSRQLLDVLQEVSPTVEYYSIDEMFFDSSRVDPLDLQQRMLKRTGIPATIGISNTRTLAKLASDNAKPFGCHVALSTEDVAALLNDRPVDEITGIAGRSKRKLAFHGIHTCADFARADRALIRRLLTKRGENLWFEANGCPVQPIQTSRIPHKCLSRGGSIGRATDDPEQVRGWLVRNVERLIEALDFHRVFCEQIGLDLEFKDGSAAGHRATLPCATADFLLILDTAQYLLAQCWRGQILSYMHILAERLSTRRCYQRGLFDQPASPDLAQVKQEINQRWGRFVLRSGSTLPLTEIYRDEANSYDICDVYGKSCF